MPTNHLVFCPTIRHGICHKWHLCKMFFGLGYNSQELTQFCEIFKIFNSQLLPKLSRFTHFSRVKLKKVRNLISAKHLANSMFAKHPNDNINVKAKWSINRI